MKKGGGGEGRDRPARYAGYGLTATLKPSPELRTLDRPHLEWLYAARTGHGDFAKYHQVFGHEDAQLRCDYGHYKTPAHLAFCPLSGCFWRDTRETFQTFLGKDWKDYIARIQRTGYFTKICRWLGGRRPTTAPYTNRPRG